MSPSPRDCLFVFFTAFLIFGFTTQNDVPSGALTSSQEEDFNQLPENARANYLLKILQTEKKKHKEELEKRREELEKGTKELEKRTKELEKEKADSVFDKFMCAMNLMRMQIDYLIPAATGGVKNKTTEIHCASREIPNDEKVEMESVIKRIMGKNDEKFTKDACKLSAAFYWAITDSNTDESKYLVGNLTKIDCNVSECAAVTAAFRKVCNNYMYFNKSETVNIYRTFSKIDLTSFFDVIHEYNNWSVTRRDLDIINIVFRSLMMSTFRYKEIKINEEKIVAVPFPDSSISSDNCLG